MAAVNYDAIAQELKRGLTDNKRSAEHIGITNDKPMILKQLYTLAFGGPRQTGKTTWIIEQVIRDVNTRVVVINTMLQDDMVRRIRNYENLDADNTIPMADGRYKVPDDLAELIRKDPLRLRVATGTIMTAAQLNSLFKLFDNDPEKEKLLPDIVQVFIDGRVQIFNAVRHSKYYTWLAKRTNGYALTWLID